jgi:hypothetical protein
VIRFHRAPVPRDDPKHKNSRISSSRRLFTAPRVIISTGETSAESVLMHTIIKLESLKDLRGRPRARSRVLGVIIQGAHLEKNTVYK